MLFNLLLHTYLSFIRSVRKLVTFLILDFNENLKSISLCRKQMISLNKALLITILQQLLMFLCADDTMIIQDSTYSIVTYSHAFMHKQFIVKLSLLFECQLSYDCRAQAAQKSLVSLFLLFKS